MIHFWQKPARITLALAATDGKNKKRPWQALPKKKIPCHCKRQNKVEILQKPAGRVPCIYKSPVLYCV